MRMRCDMTRHQSNRHFNVWALIHKVKCDCSIKKSDCIKARNHMLLDFLHLSRNRYAFFRTRASKVGMIHWTSPVTSLGHQQGRNEIRWRPGHEASLAPPCSNLRSFGSKCTVLKKVLVTLLGLFSAPPQSFGAPRNDSAPP